MSLDVVVVNYRTPGDLLTWLLSYTAHPPADPGRLTIANVAPLPADLDVVIEAMDIPGGLEHISFEDNVGYAQACNRAALGGPGDVVAFFNADTILRPHVLTDCYQAFLDEPTWGVLGPRQVNAHNRLVGAGVFGEPARPAFGAPWLALDRCQCDAIRDDALTVSGSAYFVRRAVWDELTRCPLYQRAAPGAEGAFLPTRHYYEEAFCSYHARAHGHAVVFYGPVCLTHLWHRASALGSEVDQKVGEARAIYREACRIHGIVCE